MYVFLFCCFFFFSSRRRHTRCALVTGVQTCALPISRPVARTAAGREQQHCERRVCAWLGHGRCTTSLSTISRTGFGSFSGNFGEVTERQELDCVGKSSKSDPHELE